MRYEQLSIYNKSHKYLHLFRQNSESLIKPINIHSLTMGEIHNLIRLTHDNPPFVIYMINYSSFALFHTFIVYTITHFSFVLFDSTNRILYINSFDFHFLWDHWANSDFDIKGNLLAEILVGFVS